MLIGAIEAGGTKFVCGIGNEHGEVLERTSFPTEQPEKTIGQAIDYFRDKQAEAIGIGSFGPINIDKASPKYGYVTTTPKPGWGDYPFLPELQKAFDIPFGWDTDVNAAALGEATWGAAKGLDSCLYYTIGTGVGVRRVCRRQAGARAGASRRRTCADEAASGRYVRWKMSLSRRLPGRHGAGPAIEARWGVKGSELSVDHPAWEMEAFYIGQAVAGAIVLLSPKKVILGGGVMHQRQLFPLIHEQVKNNLRGYVSAAEVVEGIADYIVPPGLGDNAGLCGSLALGLRRCRSVNRRRRRGFSSEKPAPAFFV